MKHYTILLQSRGKKIQENLPNMNVYFADSQHLLKSLIKEHAALTLAKGGFCKTNQACLYVNLFNEQLDAHDALEDVRALRRILFVSPLPLGEENLVEKSCVASVPCAVENMYLDRRHELLQTCNNKRSNCRIPRKLFVICTPSSVERDFWRH